MFKNKYLTQLQVVQAQIKNCNASIAKLRAPTTNYPMAHQLSSHLAAIMNGSENIESVMQSTHLAKNQDAFDYLEELGNYFINIAKYQKEKYLYEEELKNLKCRERELKEILGIE